MNTAARIVVGLVGLVLSTLYLVLAYINAGAAVAAAPVILLVPLALVVALGVDRARRGR